MLFYGDWASPLRASRPVRASRPSPRMSEYRGGWQELFCRG
ncbi:MAG: hypothetical protein R3C32_02530 [Chloroflexota bacterium]